MKEFIKYHVALNAVDVLGEKRDIFILTDLGDVGVILVISKISY